MNSRRKFFIQASYGLVGAVTARSALQSTVSAATSDADAAPQAARRTAAPATPAPIGPVLRWIPKQDELVYTFGGVAPRQRIKPGTRIITWTEDCYGGAIRSSADSESKVTVPGHDNPQTGPFFVEGAEPGDTLAVNILKLEPARDYAISTFAPGFGLMVGNYRTAMLGPELPEVTWRYDVDAARGVVRTNFDRWQAFVGASHLSLSRLPGCRAGLRRGQIDASARYLRGQHGLPRGPRGQHGVSGCQHARGTTVVRRRSLRHGRWGDHGSCRRGCAERRPGR